MQVDCRAPQFVTQIDRNVRSGFFLQFAMHVFCSPLHRIGAADAVCGQSRLRAVAAAPTDRNRLDPRESTVFMSIFYEGHRLAAMGDRAYRTIALLAPIARD